MEDDKITKADDIIKALECCYELDTWCSPENQDKCPLYGYEEDHCDKYLLKAALDLIKRFKAENERLKEENRIKSQKRANIFELIEKYDEGLFAGMKMFAERLKEKATGTFFEERKYVDTEDIDNLLEEMESERE